MSGIKQTHKIFPVFIAVLLAAAGANVAPAAAGMEKMAESEMEEITAAGFSEFTVENDTARMWLNINAETWTESDSFQAGYHDNGVDGEGWDQNWQGNQMGDDGDYFSASGFVVEAEFDDIDSDTRVLQRLRMGFESADGTMSSDDMQSFSGTLEDSTHSRDDIGDTDISFDGDPYMMVIDTGSEESEYDQPGIYMDFGGATPTRN